MPALHKPLASKRCGCTATATNRLSDQFSAAGHCSSSPAKHHRKSNRQYEPLTADNDCCSLKRHR